MSRVQIGLEALVNDYPEKINGARIGVVCHPASVDSGLNHALERLAEAGAKLAAIFGPEHGARGEAQDMEGVDDLALDPHLNIPVYSLYGATFESLTPKRKHLRGLDALVVDLQDIGARYYTFIWTMALCMQAAGKAGVRVLVCDRPNPLNGITTEGNLIKPGFESFVGLDPLPNRHGLTIGEIARYLQTRRGVECELDVIQMQGWERSMYFSDTELPWVLPSPNMPTLESVLVYPGMCLVEATELSEGRGTCKPFEVAGAPNIDAEALAKTLNERALPGCRFRPTYFRPLFQKHTGKTCGGVQIHITDREQFDSMLTGITFLQCVRQIAPASFTWRDKPYEFVDTIPAIDLLAGDEQLRLALEADADLQELTASWQQERSEFDAIRQEMFLY